MFVVFALLGVFRIVVPYADKPSTGWLVLTLSIVLVGLELLALRVIGRALAGAGEFALWQSALFAAAECLYPLAALAILTALNPADCFTLLVSPAYGFLYVLIAVSVLRVDWRASVLTGLVSTVGYFGLVLWSLAGHGGGPVNPHPPAMYLVLSLMLGAATAVAAFVAVQFRGYLLAAARELETRRQRDRLKRDLEIAREIQQQLLPKQLPNLSGYQFAAVSRPADETGGDYYDWQPIGPERIVVSLGDVTGHGIGPALVTAACRAYVRAILGDESAPAVVMGRVNNLLSADLSDGRFVTLALVDLDAAAHRALLLSAGHGPSLHVHANGTIDRIGAQGLPLALTEDPPWDDPVQLCLNVGDMLILCSDGFFEPSNSAGEAFGIDRLEVLIREHRHEPPALLLQRMETAVREFLGTAPQPDDMTAVITKRTA